MTSQRGRLRLDCLGSGFAFSHGRYWSGFLVNGNILLDCPPQTLAHLYRLGPDVPAALDLVLLSHEHSDHIGGVDLLLLDMMQGRASRARAGRPLAIGAPPGMYERLRAVIGPRERLPERLPERGDPRVAWFEQPAPDSFEWAGVLVERIEVEHAPDLTAHGYRLHLDGRVLAYSGDTRMCTAVEQLADGADVLIVEGGGKREHHHMEWPDVLALRARLPASTDVLVTHYDALAVPPETIGVEGLTLAEDFGVYEW